MKSVFLLVLATGCVSGQRGAPTTADYVHERIGQRVERRSPEDIAEVQGQVRELLAEPLTADAAIQVALMQSPRLQAAFEELRVARGELLGARRLPNPTVEVGVLFPVEGGEPNLDGAFVLDLGETLRVRLNSRMNADELRAAELNAAGEALSLAYETRVAFYRHQADVGLVALLSDAMMTFRAAWESSQALREAGNVRELDVAQERAAYEESRLTLAQAELRALDSREELQVLMGLSGEATEWTLAAPLSTPDALMEVPETLEAKAVEASLSLLAQRARLDAMGRRLDLARSRSAIPSLHAGVAAERDDGEWEIGPTVEMTVPLFDQGQGRRAVANAMLAREQHRYLDIGVRVRSGARRVRNRIANAAARVAFYDETMLPARETVLERTLLQYNAMGAGVFQLLAARRAVIDTARARLEALRDLWIARAALEQVLAGQMVDMETVQVEMGGSTPQSGGH